MRPTVNGSAVVRGALRPSGPPVAPAAAGLGELPLGPARALPTDATGASVPFAIMAGRLGWAGRLR